ncbi:unnamed protein product [Blepharisma stoltei]|uniref:LITAF domain-containing protein n=1 Tax=Blepharisma stoltei TaxID=1481888 RepID=A0AAU9KES3_9CILI|nr:unnamed protein product [Blepharisma stoltei]
MKTENRCLSPGYFQSSIDPSVSTMLPSLQSPDIRGSTSTFTPEVTNSPQLRTLGQRLQEKFRNLQNEYGRASEPAPESIVQVNQSRFSLPSIISGEIHEAKFIDENSEIDAYEVDLDRPLLRWCAYCNAETTTRSEYSNSTTAFWSAVGIFLMGGVFGCFMIPYMTNKCKDIKYVCHKCQHTIN